MKMRTFGHVKITVIQLPSCIIIWEAKCKLFDVILHKHFLNENAEFSLVLMTEYDHERCVTAHMQCFQPCFVLLSFKSSEIQIYILFTELPTQNWLERKAFWTAMDWKWAPMSSLTEKRAVTVCLFPKSPSFSCATVRYTQHHHHHHHLLKAVV